MGCPHYQGSLKEPLCPHTLGDTSSKEGLYQRALMAASDRTQWMLASSGTAAIPPPWDVGTYQAQSLSYTQCSCPARAQQPSLQTASSFPAYSYENLPAGGSEILVEASQDNRSLEEGAGEGMELYAHSICSPASAGAELHCLRQPPPPRCLPLQRVMHPAGAWQGLGFSRTAAGFQSCFLY